MINKLKKGLDFLKKSKFYIKEQKSLYIKILLWTYDRQQDEGFKKNELYESFAPTPQLKRWVEDIFFKHTPGNQPLISHFDSRDGIDYFTLTQKGIAATIHYLELQHTKEGNRISNMIAYTALVATVATMFFTLQSLDLTRDSLELSSDAILEILPNFEKIPEEVDIVEKAIGLIPAQNSLLELLLINNSTPEVVDVDIRMSLWFLDRDPGGSLFELCPLGYVDHTDNPEFKVLDLNTSNVLNDKFSLKNTESYPFSFDYSNLNYIDPWKENLSKDAVVFLKIDVFSKKKVSQTRKMYTKIFRIFNNETIVDVDLSPDFGYIIGTRIIDTRRNPNKLVSAFYPFENKDFIDYFKSIAIPENLIFRECDKFEVNKKIKELSY